MSGKLYITYAVCWLLVLMLGLSAADSGCRRKTIPGESAIATERRSVEFLQKKLRGQTRNELRSLYAETRIYAEGNGQSIQASANIIWLRDSVLWVNVKKFGLEAARALLTKDSIFVLNRLEKTWSARSLESLQRQYNLPAGFELVEQVLLGEPWFFKDIALDSDVKDGQHRMWGNNNRFSAEYRLSGDHFRLNTEEFMQKRDQSSVSIGFGAYKNTEPAGYFPYLRTVEAFSPETGELGFSVEIKSMELNTPKGFRFEIPAHYEKID